LPKDAKSILEMNSPPAPVRINDLVRAILRDPVESINELCVILRCENERPTVGMKLDNQHTSRIPRQAQTAVGVEVVISKRLHLHVLLYSSSAPH
jgi:hypothetical protein